MLRRISHQRRLAQYYYIMTIIVLFLGSLSKFLHRRMCQFCGILQAWKCAILQTIGGSAALVCRCKATGHDLIGRRPPTCWERCAAQRARINFFLKWYQNQNGALVQNSRSPGEVSVTGTLTSFNRVLKIGRAQIVAACLVMLASCNSLNSFYDSVVGAGDKPIPPPTFSVPSEQARQKTAVRNIEIIAPPKGTVLLEGSVKYGIRNYVATYSLEDSASISFSNVANALFEIDDRTAAGAKLDATINFQVHTGSRFLCKVTWETVATVNLTVSIDDPAGNPGSESYSSSVEESLCAAAGVQLFPSAEAVTDLLQRAFDETVAKALSAP